MQLWKNFIRFELSFVFAFVTYHRNTEKWKKQRCQLYVTYNLSENCAFLYMIFFKDLSIKLICHRSNTAGRQQVERLIKNIFHFLIQPAFHPYTYFTESHWMAFSELAVILYWVAIKQDMTKISDFIKPCSWHIILYLSDIIRPFCPKVYVAKWGGPHYGILI